MKIVKNQIIETTYSVEKYSKDGQFLGVVSGMGRNAGTWDSEAKSKRTAHRWAKILRTEDRENLYTVVEN